MPIQTACPSCGKPLRVPDDLIGKNVKCPGCQTQFVAEPVGSESPPPLPRESRREEGYREQQPERRPRREEEYEEERPSPRSSRRGDAYEEDDRDRGDDEYDRPRRRRSTEYAQSKVAGPAICLMVTGGLVMALALFAIVFSLVMMGNPGAMGGGGAGQGGFGAGPGGGKQDPIFNAIGGVVTLIWSGLIFMGGLQMKGLKSRGLAMTGAIASLIPCSLCCILTLPFGIWALVVLNDEQVKNAFG